MVRNALKKLLEFKTMDNHSNIFKHQLLIQEKARTSRDTQTTNPQICPADLLFMVVSVYFRV